MINLVRYCVSISLLCSAAFVAIANDNSGVSYPDCEALQNHASTQDTDIPILQPILIASKEFMLVTCEAFNEDDIRGISDRDFLTKGMLNGNRAELVKLLQQNFSQQPFPDISNLIIDWQALDYVQALNSQLYSLKAIERKRRDEYAFMKYNGSSNVSFVVDDEMQNTCLRLSNKDCATFFAELERVTAIQNAFLGSNEIKQALPNTIKKRKAWERFGEEARFMTFIDIAFTSWVYNDEFSNGKSLPSPPEYQFFALRPSIVYEHFSAARAGEKGELTLAVEWVGVNKWDAALPIGVSLTTVYADRSKGRKLGHGLMLHINNSVSIGFANRGGNDNSVYINIDLLEWYASFDAYGSFKNYLAN